MVKIENALKYGLQKYCSHIQEFYDLCESYGIEVKDKVIVSGLELSDRCGNILKSYSIELIPFYSLLGYCCAV